VNISKAVFNFILRLLWRGSFYVATAGLS